MLFYSLVAPCKDSHRFSMAPQHSEEMGLVLGICAGGLVVFIVLLGAVIIIVRKGYVPGYS